MPISRLKSSHHIGTKDDVNLLPLMNLFIVLIPTLLLSAAYLKLAAVDVGLAGEPTVETNMIHDPVDLRVWIEGDMLHVTAVGRSAETIDRGGQWRPSLDHLLREIASAHPDEHGITIVSGPSTRYEEVIQVMDVARAAGLSEISLQAAESNPPER